MKSSSFKKHISDSLRVEWCCITFLFLLTRDVTTVLSEFHAFQIPSSEIPLEKNRPASRSKSSNFSLANSFALDRRASTFGRDRRERTDQNMPSYRNTFLTCTRIAFATASGRMYSVAIT